MSNICSMERTLSANLPWQCGRIKFLAAFALDDIGSNWAGQYRYDSQYMKLQHSFRFFALPYANRRSVLA